jgi:aldose 1-epimerase
VTPANDRVVRIAGGALEVEILPAIGARLHRLRVDGHDILRTPDDIERHHDDGWFWGSYPMAPWCNRLPAGPGRLAGHEVRLEPNFPDGTAIHGQVSRREWEADGEGRFRIEAGGDGWPWRYEVEQEIAIVGERELRMSIRLTNRSTDAMPGGIGFHPWFRDPVEVAIRAASTHPSNFATDALPVAVTGTTDRRDLGPFPEGLDATWTDLASPPVLLAWPTAGLTARISASSTGRFIVAARPAGIPAVAVEAQTHAPDSGRRLERHEPGALEVIEPGDSLEMTMTLSFEPAAPRADQT